MIGIEWFVLRGSLSTLNSDWDFAVWGHPTRVPRFHVEALKFLLEALHNANSVLLGHLDRYELNYTLDRVGMHPAQSDLLARTIEEGGTSAVAWIAVQPMCIQPVEDNGYGE